MGRGGREFNPTAAELISYYLKNHILGISYPASDIIPQSTVFGDQLNPWDKFSDPCHWCLDSHNIPTLYLHTKLENIGTTSKSSNVQKKRMAGCGTWHSTGAPIEVHFPGNKDLVIGHYKKLSFRTNNGEETIGHWTMNEYTISADAFPEIRGCDWEDRVICRIKRYDDRSCIGGKVIKNNSSSTRRNTVSNKRKNSSSIESTEPIKKLKSLQEPSNQMTAPVVVVLDDDDGGATMPEPSNQMAAPVVVVLDDDDGEATMPKEWTNSDALEFEELMNGIASEPLHFGEWTDSDALEFEEVMNGTTSEPLHFEEWKDSDVLEFEDMMNGIEWDASEERSFCSWAVVVAVSAASTFSFSAILSCRAVSSCFSRLLFGFHGFILKYGNLGLQISMDSFESYVFSSNIKCITSPRVTKKWPASIWYHHDLVALIMMSKYS